MASNVHPKMTNQLFVASHNNNHDPMDSLNAATFVAVVSSNLAQFILGICAELCQFTCLQVFKWIYFIAMSTVLSIILKMIILQLGLIS